MAQGEFYLRANVNRHRKTFERVLMIRHFTGGAVFVLLYHRRIMDSCCIYAIHRQAPKSVGNWALAGALGKKATEEEEYRPPFEVESAKK